MRLKVTMGSTGLSKLAGRYGRTASALVAKLVLTISTRPHVDTSGT
jgi:hypothetical protein